MPKKILRTLAINPGSHYIGIAHFVGYDLQDWAIKCISSLNFKNTTALISEFCQYKCPDYLALKKLHPSRSSKNLRSLVRKIKAFAEDNGVKIYQYDIEDLKRSILGTIHSHKKNLADALVSTYPGLLHDYHQEQANKNPYHIRMFEAVALGTVCSRQLD